MAKRFTDTMKWGKASFADINNDWKLIWIYLCDNCDHAGIWDVNWRLLQFHIGISAIDRRAMEAVFKEKVVFLSDTKVFIPSFVEFQYGELNPENRAHLSVINRLKKEGAYKVLTRSSEGRKDKDKEKDKEKVLGESEGIFEKLWSAVPNKTGKSKAKKVFDREIKAGTDPELMFKALAAFLAHHKRKGTAAEFVPMGSTFMNSWRDWLDPDAGESQGFAQTPSTSLDDLDLTGGRSA